MCWLSISVSYAKWCVVLSLILIASAAYGQAQPSEKTPNPAAQPSVITDPLAGIATKKKTVENLNSLSLAGSDLHIAPPLRGGKSVFPEFTRDSLRVQWREGDPIDLYIMRPNGVNNPPVILYLWGFPSENDRFRNNEFCKIVTRDGFAAVGFVSALTGHRYHDRPMREWFISELQESLVTTVHDVQMILDYLASRKDFDMTKVGMFGQGSGATIAILAAATDRRIKVVDVLDPWGDWPDWMPQSKLIPEEERANFVKPEFLKRVAPYDPLVWLGKLKSRPMRLQEAMYEKDTPQIAKRRMEEALPRTAQVVHYYAPKEFSEKAVADGKMVNWIKGQVKAVSPEHPGKVQREGRVLQTASR